MLITILSVSDGDKGFSGMVEEYGKRLGKQVTINNIKPIKHGTISQIIAKETDLVINRLKKLQDKPICLLSKTGQQYSSEKFAELATSGSIVFVIGGPYGLDETRLQSYCQYFCSFGAHTMPHGLVKVVLLEQLWRAHCITTGRSYHY